MEQKHQHLLNVARSLLFQSRVPIKFWGECILTACFLINRTPSPLLQWSTPFFRLNEKHVDYTNIHVFGSLCFASTMSQQRSKFHPRALPIVFLGYPTGMKGFRLYDNENQKIFVSRDVVFHEHIFPFHKITSPEEIVDSFPDLVLPKDFNFSDYNPNTTQFSFDLVQPQVVYPTNLPANIGIDPINSDSLQNDVDSHVVSSTNGFVTENVAYSHVDFVGPCTDVQPRRSSRATKLPSYLKDYHCSLLYSSVDGDFSLLETKSQPKYPLSDFLAYDKLSPTYRTFVLNVSSVYEPQYFHQAVYFPHWREAMDAELQARENNNTWNVVSLPPRHHSLVVNGFTRSNTSLMGL